MDQYLKELPEIFKEPAKIIPFLEGIFIECWQFVLQDPRVTHAPEIELKLIPDSEQFRKIVKEESRHSKSLEEARQPEMTTAFTVGDFRKQTVYVDLEAQIKLLERNYETFILSLVEDYLHEIIHCVSVPTKPEQEVFDMECSLTEGFFGIVLPEERKRLRAEDYYSRIEED